MVRRGFSASPIRLRRPVGQHRHTLQQRMPFPIRALQIDGGSEFAADFEQACQPSRPTISADDERVDSGAGGDPLVSDGTLFAVLLLARSLWLTLPLASPPFLSAVKNARHASHIWVGRRGGIAVAALPVISSPYHSGKTLEHAFYGCDSSAYGSRYDDLIPA